ncbi:ester cyclase [Nocardia vinacea]|uniref:ester cyclase n=1 Tax=Nocardia vinacea TaxID=96468 RepID=UPI0002F9D1E8|nr:ester cyclase [Nocardia vinacea]
MSSKSVESVMHRFVEFINTADEDLAREVIAPDAVFHAPSHAEPLRGPAGYLEIIAMMRGAFPDVRWTLEESVTEGSTVAARFTMRGTHEGEFFGVPATGNKIEVQAMNFYYLADGRIVEERGLPDLLGVMQQIGALSAP